MNNKIYIVTALDPTDSPNGVPELIGKFPSYEEAKACVIQEMHEYCDNYTFVDDVTGKTVGPRKYDENEMFIENFDGSAYCRWNIVEANA